MDFEMHCHRCDVVHYPAGWHGNKFICIQCGRTYTTDDVDVVYFGHSDKVTEKKVVQGKEIVMAEITPDERATILDGLTKIGHALGYSKTWTARFHIGTWKVEHGGDNINPAKLCSRLCDMMADDIEELNVALKLAPELPDALVPSALNHATAIMEKPIQSCLGETEMIEKSGGIGLREWAQQVRTVALAKIKYQASPQFERRS